MGVKQGGRRNSRGGRVRGRRNMTTRTWHAHGGKKSGGVRKASLARRLGPPWPRTGPAARVGARGGAGRAGQGGRRRVAVCWRRAGVLL